MDGIKMGTLITEYDYLEYTEAYLYLLTRLEVEK